MATSFFENIWKTADGSPGWHQEAAGHLVAEAGTPVDAVPEFAGRVKAIITPYEMDGGRLWVRYDGAPAEAGWGEVVYEGERWSEPTPDAVSVLFEPRTGSSVTSCSIATSQVGAG